tara:strand:+ start:225 stop:503 length:279 start_codon:yes stop_codon:yes gene_type:complete
MKRNETKSGRKLEQLKKIRLLKYEKELDQALRGYDHLVHYKDDCTISAKDDRIDDNIRTIILKHNYKVQQVSKMFVKDFDPEERLQLKDGSD